MFVIRPKSRPFTWFVTDHPNIKGQTVCMELEYEVIDRQFHCSVQRRNHSRDHFGERRAATPQEMTIAKAAIGEKELARCVAESINPSIWARARHSAEQKRRVLTGFKLYVGDQEFGEPFTASLPTPQS
jgi:hypothetical protein